MYDGGVGSSSERRRLRHAGGDDAVKEYRVAIGVQHHVRAEEETAMSGKVVVDREAALCVERLYRRRLNQTLVSFNP